jgi:hypothetical protein
MKSSTPKNVAASRLGVPLDLLTEQATGSATVEILHSVTTNIPDGQPWPPPDRDVLWAVVRRAGATPRSQLLKSGNCDRAAVVTTALLQIILSSSTPRSGLRQHVEELLRDEFADVERQAAADRTNVDA